MFENIMLSIRGIRSHKMRSALTMLGIIIGIAAIIVIVSIIGGASAELKDQMVGDSTNTVKVSLYSKDEKYSSYAVEEKGPIVGITTIDDDTINQVLDIDGISDATSVYIRLYAMDVAYLANNTYCSGYGVDADYFPFSGLVLTSGRLFTNHDYENHNNVVIITDSLASDLFRNEDPIGKTMQCGNELFTVVGVMTKLVDYSEIKSITDYYVSVGFDDKAVYIPTTSWNDAAGYDDIQKLVVKIDDPDKIITAATAAADVLNSTLPESTFEYKSGTLTEDADYLKEIMRITSLLLVGIASISLLVGGIGVMNIMLVSVTERTREIGLKKALGARRRVILGQFLTESVVLTSIGGMIGVLIGIGLAKLVGMIVQMPIVISVGAIAISVGFSMGVGIIFGLVPSVKAANLNPIDALRYE